MERPYFIIDVFTHQRFAGNPAAVVLEADGLAEAEMQSIAAEFNLGATGFVLTGSDPSLDRKGAVLPAGRTARQSAATPSGDGLESAYENRAESGVQESGPRFFTRLRWFTPTVELAMCGHATIASLRALVETGRIKHHDPMRSTVAEIETASGLLLGFVERIPDAERDLMIWLDLVDPTFASFRISESEWSHVLGIPTDSFDPTLAVVRTQDRDMLLFVCDFTVVNDARPDFRRLKEVQLRDDLRGTFLSTTRTLTPSITAQSRFFAPSIGLDEDLVSGSVHGPLGAYLVHQRRVSLHDGLAGMSCVQGKPGGRAGLVNVLVQPQPDGRSSVRIGGRTAIVMRGTLYT